MSGTAVDLPPGDTCRDWKRVETHISEIRHDDVILENGRAVTVSGRDIKRDGFMGVTLRGNSYCGGREPVVKLVYAPPPNPYAWGAS